MDVRRLRIAMNGVTGRMGYRQHLVRSVLAIRDAGGFPLADGTGWSRSRSWWAGTGPSSARWPGSTASRPGPPTAERFREQWADVPDNGEFDNGFKVQWEQFLRGSGRASR